MNHATTSKKAVSLLLILAMLSVLIAAFVPFVSTATEEEFQDFSYQTPNDYDMIDATTSLRFVFTVPEDKVDGYTAAGFVLSKSVAEPEVDAANCLTCPTTKVYSAITADGKTEDAPDGRFWVAVKLINIPQSYFDGTIYVRAYVTDGTGTRYSAAKEISVWGANAIEYFTKWDEQKWNGMSYSIKDPDFPSIKYKITFAMKNEVKNVRGSDHFYPTNENPTGNDLFFEFSFLRNESHANLKGESPILAVTYIENYNVFNINLKTGIITATERSGDVVNYKANSSGEIDVGYGWHRFGMRIHQNAVNNAGEVEYTITATAYLDGERIFEIDKTEWVLSKCSAKVDGRLFLATADGENDLTYEDPAENLTNQVWLMNQKFWEDNTDPIWLILEDVSISCANNFKQQVVPIMDPANRTYKTASYTRDETTYQRSFNAPVYYALPLTDPLVFNGNDDEAPSGWKGKSNTDFSAPNETFKTLADQKGSFYPTPGNPEGNDLLVEFSILWNDTLHADSGKWANLGQFSKTDNSVTTSWLYFDNGQIELNDGIDDGGIIKYPDPFTDYDNLTGNGWHRIGIRYHQTAAKDGGDVAYTLTYTIYVDGVKVNEVQTAPERFIEKGYLLYTATIKGEGLDYADNTDEDKKFSWLFISHFFGSSHDKYLVLADLNITSGHDFMQQVVPVASPSTGATITLGGNVYPAEMYYQLAD